MKLETFLEKFDQFAGAPDAILRMRRLILNLAVRGKLVAQDANDESACELLKRIQDEKARLVKAGEIKKQAQLSQVGEDAIKFKLASGWVPSQLGDVAVCLDYMREPINGSQRDLRIAGKDQSELFPYYGATQQQGWIDDYIFDEELVLLGEDGVPFFDDLRPKAYLVSGKTWVNNHAHVFRGIFVSNSFLMHWLNVFDYTGRVAGSTRSKLNQAKAVNIPIPLPPLAEQKRIVAKVDELMALCDRLEAQQQERDTRRAALARASLARFADAPTPANLQFLFHKSYDIDPADLRNSILTLAVQGKLVPQDPNDENSEVLVRKIAEAKREMVDAGSMRPLKNLSAVTAKEKEFPLPAGWIWARLQEVIDVRDGTHDSPKDCIDPDSFPLVTSRNFQDGEIEFESARRISAQDHFEIQRRSKVERDDILFSMIGGNIGNQVIVKTDVQFSVKNVALFKYYDRALTHPLFIKRFMEHLAIRLQQEASGGAQPFVSLGYLRRLPIALPPTAEQHRIVAKVDQLMALVDQLETQLAESRATANNLLEALVAELTAAGASSPKALA